MAHLVLEKVPALSGNFLQEENVTSMKVEFKMSSKVTLSQFLPIYNYA